MDVKIKKARDVLILSTADWDNPSWTNKQHMAVQFAQHGWRVLYVDSLGLRRPVLKKKDFLRIGKRLINGLKEAHEVRSSIWRISPLVLPFQKHAIIRRLNLWILRWTLRWHMMKLSIKMPVIWTYNPLLFEVCAELPSAGIVYHCVDDLGAAPHIHPQSIYDGEMQLGKIADLCFTTSAALQERMQALFSQCVCEPNVCDYDLFHTAVTEPLEEPEELRFIPHPRLIFIGALSEYKVDFDLIRFVAQCLPNVHWVLIGPDGEGQPDSNKPPVLPNVHMLGPKPYHRLPSFLKYGDMAVLPAVHNNYTDAMFPMKFFEYLASGVQVVATALPSLREFQDLYFPADSKEDFVSAIKIVLAGEKRNAVSIEAACHRHSWESRMERLEKILWGALNAKTTAEWKRTDDVR